MGHLYLTLCALSYQVKLALGVEQPCTPEVVPCTCSTMSAADMFQSLTRLCGACRQLSR